MTRVRLGPGREFDLIRQSLQELGLERGDVPVGPGDDAAVVNSETSLVLSTDLTVEGVHFRSSWLSPREVGARATSAALSDLAAMAANPVGVLLSYAIDNARVAAWAPELTAGASQAVGRFGGVILGGDLSSAPDGAPIVVDVVAVGATDNACTRSGAKLGDALWITGRLGLPALAVRAWESGNEPKPEARDRFCAPTPRVVEAQWLRKRLEITSMIDVSDGLAADAGHIAAASGVGLAIEASCLPIASALSRAMDTTDAQRFAATSGEEYELLFTAPKGAVDGLVDAFRSTHGTDLTCVGEVTSGAGVRIVGIDVSGLDPGHDHFRTSG